MLIFTHDKVRLEEHFRRDPVMFAYHLGDLDDFYFGRCQWGATYHKSTRIDECILIYHAPFGSTAIAFGLSERFGPLLEEALVLLPNTLYCHFFGPYRSILARVYTEKRLGTGIRMKLGALHDHHHENDIRHIQRLGPENLAELSTFYKESYPGAYVEDRMVSTGKFLAWMDGERIAAVAGVHVYSAAYRVAVLGSIATHPDYRGRGLATKLTSLLSSELVAEGLLVCLNVMNDNVPAVRCYENLGFERAFEYEESRLELR